MAWAQGDSQGRGALRAGHSCTPNCSVTVMVAEQLLRRAGPGRPGQGLGGPGHHLRASAPGLPLPQPGLLPGPPRTVGYAIAPRQPPGGEAAARQQDISVEQRARPSGLALPGWSLQEPTEAPHPPGRCGAGRAGWGRTEAGPGPGWSGNVKGPHGLVFRL